MRASSNATVGLDRFCVASGAAAAPSFDFARSSCAQLLEMPLQLCRARAGLLWNSDGSSLTATTQLTRKRQLAKNAVEVEEGDGGEDKAKGDQR